MRRKGFLPARGAEVEHPQRVGEAEGACAESTLSLRINPARMDREFRRNAMNLTFSLGKC